MGMGKCMGETAQGYKRSKKQEAKELPSGIERCEEQRDDGEGEGGDNSENIAREKCDDDGNGDEVTLYSMRRCDENEKLEPKSLSQVRETKDRAKRERTVTKT